MRKFGKKAAAFVLAFGSFAVWGMTAFAASSPVIVSGQGAKRQAEPAAVQSTQEEAEMAALNGLGIRLEELDAAKDPAVEQLVVVVGNGMDSSQVKLGYYVKNRENPADWNEEFVVDGYCGHNGMSVDKREGDRRTPVGTYSFIQAFGTLENPGAKLPYKQLDQYDYWVDDSDSIYYNQMVSTRQVEKDWKSAEHLMSVVPQYRYSLALNYNTQERTPGKGSAIFLHCYHDWKTWTEGCIAIPEANMKTLARQLDGAAKIVILPEVTGAVLE